MGPTALAIMTLLALTTSLAAQQPPQERLWDAAKAGDTTAIASALAAGAKIDSLDTRSSRNGRYALNWATLSDKPAAVQQLISRGAKVNATNLTGFTALHHAAEVGAVSAARVLLADGADPTWATNMGQTPAQVARERNFPAVAALIDSAAGPKP